MFYIQLSSNLMILAVSSLALIATLQLAIANSIALSKTTGNQLLVKQLQSSVHNKNFQQSQQQNDFNIDYETHYYDQLVNHFDWNNTNTYKQRYLINKQHWCGKNCPILFYTGNEGDIEMFTNNTGFMWENAPRLSAMLVFAEHRYYGKSMPFPGIDPSLIAPSQTPKLRFLSSEQALADFAKLIHAIKNELYDAKYSPVIALGGSYGGMLSAWLRMKYPQVVTGALAGSAPIFQFANTEYKCNDFNKIVTKDFENYSQNCSKSISQSWQTMRNLAATSNGIKVLKAAFNICENQSEFDESSLIGFLNEIWVNMAMTDYANKATFLSEMPEYPIKHACVHLSEDPDQLKPDKLVQQISLASQVFTNFTGKQECLDLDEATHGSMDVLWDFQSCTEMVMPICSDGVNDMFEPDAFNVKQFVKSCKEKWNVTTQVNKVAIEYGVDKNLPSASNIIFSYCTRDPWSAGSPQTSFVDRQIHAIKIDGVCHHEDLRFSGPNDGSTVKAAREQELNIISEWIGRHYESVRKEFGDIILEPSSTTAANNISSDGGGINEANNNLIAK